eukprot:2308113-Rhodomonas_salina.3
MDRIMSSLAARMVEAPDTQPDAPTDAQTHAQHAHPASPGAAPIEDVAAPGVTEEGGKGSEYDGEGSAVADDDMDALPMRVRGGDAAVVAGRLLAEVYLFCDPKIVAGFDIRVCDLATVAAVSG